VAWEVEFTDEFGEWWDSLTAQAQSDVDATVMVLRQFGPALTRPLADTVRGSRFANMRELRVQHGGKPYRILYAFDPRRAAILLLGGDKTGNSRWYDEYIPKADAIYEEHLREIGEQ
jgi:hypothetical protein